MAIKTETDVQLEMAAALKSAGFEAHYQDAAYKKNAALRSALTGSSKSSKKNGIGKPDGVIFADNTCGKVIALIEMKGEGDFEKAREEAQNYVRAVAAKNCYVALAVAYDGRRLAVDFFSEKSEVPFRACRLDNGQTIEDRFVQTGRWPTVEELLTASRSRDGQIQENHDVLENKITRDFILKINNTFQNESVPILDRVVVFTAFLVACRTDLFKDIMRREETQPAKVGRVCLAAIKGLIEDVDDSDVQAGLNGFCDFVKPKLEAKGETPNGANAIHAILHQVIPEIESKHSISREDLIERMNKSMFNLVDVYEAFQAYAPDNDLGQYFTPRHIVRAMIRLVEEFRDSPLNERDVVYDPACGVGGFLVGALEAVAKSKHGEERAKVKRLFGERLIGCDPAQEIIQVARVNLWMHGDGSSLLSRDSSLERHYLTARGKGTKPGDCGMDKPVPDNHPVNKSIATLSAKETGDIRPTVVLMNPPFPTKAKDFHAFEFIEHALKTLCEGGHLCAIVPATTIVVEDKAHVAFRQRLAQHAQILAVIGNAPDLFAPGASVNTYMLLLRKQASGHQVNQPVLFARCPDDGYVMDKSTQRRVGAVHEDDYKKRRWTKDLFLGGDLADLLTFNSYNNAADGRTWVEKHLDGGVDVRRHAVSAVLPRQDINAGKEWAPEKFIRDEVDLNELLRLANRIYAEAQAFELVKAVGGVW